MMQAGDELDAMVAAKVMGLDAHEVGEPVYEGFGSVGERTVYVLKGEDGAFSTDIPCYSTDIAAAWQVVAKIQEQGWRLTLYANPPHDCIKPAAAGFGAIGESMFGRCETADTAPHAICLAALKVLGCDLVAETKKEAPGETAAPLDRGAQGSYC